MQGCGEKRRSVTENHVKARNSKQQKSSVPLLRWDEQRDTTSAFGASSSSTLGEYRVAGTDKVSSPNFSDREMDICSPWVPIAFCYLEYRGKILDWIRSRFH
ncbi:hypothetical protein AVEN_166669-1 [Araneus ventricosus]|uniref:Uncharacterized protein n=1 Tax=Araneus ventricosus TaxID=182803 RepID=A0A4Y2VT05_ARAVE|nr:hypothetical protein AVEN_48062-1 [Araneus ventricosus]GBO28523.1 hypothetical protein AVEN_166669-1 [Araneus ventricosus]